MNRARVLWLALCVVAVLGCSRSHMLVQPGVSAYQRGDDRAAMDHFLHIEGEVPDMNTRAMTRYLVYRGLTAYNLGDKQQARQYLMRGRMLYERGEAAWLSPNISVRMNDILVELETPKGAAPNEP